MENQLINLELVDLSIEDFDSSSLKSLKAMLVIDEKSYEVTYPFRLMWSSASLPLTATLDFLYKSRSIARTTLDLPKSLPAKVPFELTTNSSIEISPEKQRPKTQDSKSLKSVGQGTLIMNECESALVSNDYHKIALDLTTLLRGQGELSVKEVESLRILIIGLNFKLKSVCFIQEKSAAMKAFAEQSLHERENMQNRINETCAELSRKNQETDEYVKVVQHEKRALQQDYDELMQRFREKCGVETELLGKIEVLEAENLNLCKKIKNFDDMTAMIEDLKKQIKSLEAERDVFREDFRKTIKAFDEDTASKLSEVSARDAEIATHLLTITSKSSEIQKLSDEKASYFTLIKELEAIVDDLNAQLRCLNDRETKAAQFEALATAHQLECTSLQSKLSLTCSEFSSKVNSLSEEKSAIFSNIQKLSSEITKLKQELHEKNSIYKAEVVRSQDLRTKSAIIQQKLANTLDLTKLFSQIKYLSKFASEVKDKMVEDNDNLVISLLKSNEDYLSAIRIILQVRDIIEDRDTEISILRELIAELQNKTHYYPVKDDPVDEAIADYLNSRPEPLPIAFIREDYGLYLFGTKKVFIKLENNKITSKI